MFSLWRPTFTRSLSVVPSRFANKVREVLARCVDTLNGGVVQNNQNLLELLGEGVSVNPVVRLTNSHLRPMASARMPRRIERVTVTTGDVTVRDGDLSDVVLVTGSGMTASRTLTVDVTADTLNGETVLIVAPDVNAPFQLNIASAGATAANPIFALPFPGTPPVSVWLRFDSSLTADNANGEWTPFGHGRA